MRKIPFQCRRLAAIGILLVSEQNLIRPVTRVDAAHNGGWLVILIYRHEYHISGDIARETDAKKLNTENDKWIFYS